MSKPLNRIKCAKCNDVIVSRHRHDFVTCSCGAVSCDGGQDYSRYIGNTEDFLVFRNRKWVGLNSVLQDAIDKLNPNRMDSLIVGCGMPRNENNIWDREINFKNLIKKIRNIFGRNK